MSTSETTFPRRTFVLGAGVAATAACGMLFSGGSTTAFADEIADKQAEADAVLASLNAMQETLDQLSDEYTQAILDQEEAQRKMDEAQVAIDETSGKISSYQGKLSTRVRGMYRSGSSTFIDVLTGSSTFEEFAVGLDLLNDMSESDARLVSTLKRERTNIEELRAEYSVQEQTAAQKAAEAEEKRTQAEATVAQYQATYDNLSAEIAELVEQKRQAEEAARAAAAAAAVAASQAQARREQAQTNAVPTEDTNGDGVVDDDDDVTDYYDDEDDYYDAGGVYEGGDDVVSRAYACLGAPYVWAAVGPEAYDCSGLVSYCISGSHVRLFTSATLMGYAAVSDPMPGDVAVKSGHCGIYIGGGQMIHAADYGIGVIIGSVQSGMKIVRP